MAIKRPPISIVAAMGAQTGVLGRTGEIIWNLEEDREQFKELTTGMPVIMGRKLFETMGKVLPHRTNIILTSQTDHHPEGVHVAHSLEEAIEIAKKEDPFEIFIIGGATVFQQAMPIVDRLYLTLVYDNKTGDVVFPMDYKKHFPHLISRIERENNGMRYAYVILERD